MSWLAERDIWAATFRVDEACEGRVRTLRPVGSLDLATSDQLVETVRRVCAERDLEVILDLEGVAFIDTAGVRAILECRDIFTAHNCGVWLLAPGPLRRTLERFGVFDALPVRQGTA